MLYVVPTPIGNLEDISFRALRVLKEVDYILCEDTRVTSKLLASHDISNHLRSYHAHNEHQRTESIIEDLQTGIDVALVSDAGYPGISDPGFLLLRACQKENVEFTLLPGSSSLLPAIVGSGLPCDKFYFEGFLPHKKGRQTRLKTLVQLELTSVIFESPHRLLKLLNELKELAGPEREVCVAREISKIHEEYYRGSLDQVIKYFSGKNKVKGEIVVVLSGNK